VGQKHSAQSQRFPARVSHQTEPVFDATTYPLTVAECPRNLGEIIHVALDQYYGREVVNARAWWRDQHGKWRPGQSRLTLSLKHLRPLAEALAGASRRPQALGLVE